MKILVLPRPREGVARETMEQHAATEIQAVLDLYAQDVVREIYARGDQPGRVALVLEAPSVEDARSALTRLPFVRFELIDVDLIPLAPFSGLVRLAQMAQTTPRAS